jgi:hypothetical protein
MKIKVTRRFIDRANNMVTREPGEVYEAPDERGNFLIQLGLAEKIEEPEQEVTAVLEESEPVEAPQNEGKTEVEEAPAEPKKTSKRGKKAAE